MGRLVFPGCLSAGPNFQARAYNDPFRTLPIHRRPFRQSSRQSRSLTQVGTSELGATAARMAALERILLQKSGCRATEAADAIGRRSASAA
jgi:hypothetical protein